MLKKFLPLLTGLLLLASPLTAKANGDLVFVTAYNEIGSMADGAPAHYGAIACPSSMQLGQGVHIEGLGDYVCEDRMASWLSFRFDISLPGASIAECYAITGYYNWWLI